MKKIKDNEMNALLQHVHDATEKIIKCIDSCKYFEQVCVCSKMTQTLVDNYCNLYDLKDVVMPRRIPFAKLTGTYKNRKRLQVYIDAAADTISPRLESLLNELQPRSTSIGFNNVERSATQVYNEVQKYIHEQDNKEFQNLGFKI